MQPLCSSNCFTVALLILCTTLALNVYNMRKSNKAMTEQFSSSNNEYTEAKTSLAKCQHDLKSQETVLSEIKSAVDDAKKKNFELEKDLSTCKAYLEKKNSEEAKKEELNKKENEAIKGEDE